MVYSENWNLVDVFTVVQAAYLWSDLDPPDDNVKETFAGGRPPAVAAIIQVIQGAIEVGQLTVNWHDRLAEASKDYFQVSVARSNLAYLAKAKRQFPGFLFDTLVAGQNEEVGTGGRAPAPKEPPIRNPVGRPSEYDWDGCIAKVIHIADTDGLPSVQNELIRLLQNWFIKTYDVEPSDSEFKRRISPIYGRLKEFGWKPRDG